MIRHFFLDKTNTIIEGSTQNVGLNPILSIGYGKFIMRGLIHFDLSEIRGLIEDKTFADTSKLTFTLKMTNCFSVDNVPYEKKYFMSFGESMKRASSVSAILFKLPCNFDMGRGYDFRDDFYVVNKSSNFDEASNWYFARTMIPWEYEREKFDLDDPNLNVKTKSYFDRKKIDKFEKDVFRISEKINTGEYDIEEIKDDLEELSDNVIRSHYSLHGGIYSQDTLDEEYSNYIDGRDSIIVGSQDFDFGNENLSIDITGYVLDCINYDENNYGLCLSFAPTTERIGSDEEEFGINFFTDHTNTFFHPYIECNYCETIKDDRESFTIGKPNRLYLYVSDDGEPVNLDKLPTCEANGEDVEVKQATKGVYYATVSASKDDFEPAAIYYDKWSEIALNGLQIEDVELEFSTRPWQHKLSVGDESKNKNNLVPFLSGINDNESINRGEIRTVIVEFREKFSTDKRKLASNAEYRLYVKDGNRELDVIQYHPIEKSFLNNFFNIYSSDLIPQTYYVDIRVTDRTELRYFKNVLRFNVISNITERYE